MNATLETCRLVYNSLLNSRKCDYELLGKSPSRIEQINTLPKWRREFPEIADVYSQVLQNVAFRVDLAYRAFFRRCKEKGERSGFPRFKGDGYDSFCYPQSGFAVHESAVYLSKIGQVKTVLHRLLVGKIKTCTVRRQAGKWFVCFACDYEMAPLPPSNLQIGIDLGLKSFAALSDGTFVDNPKFFRVDEKALAKAGRKQAKTKKRSAERRKANKVLSRIHERIRNRRHNFVHQTARRIVNKYGVIAVEKLNVKNMVQNHCLAKSISDSSWSMFRTILTQKAECAARELIAVNPSYTSQDCHQCGYRAKKKLCDRWHSCPICGASLDRDTNAAINILKLCGTTHSQRLAVVEAPCFSTGE